MTVPEATLRAGKSNGRADVLGVEGFLHFRGAGFFLWLMMLHHVEHVFPGIANLVRLLKGTFVPEGSKSGTFTWGRGRGFKSQGGFAMPPRLWVSGVALPRRAPTVSSREGGPGWPVNIKNQFETPSISPV